jgi:excisionase family DNA binding protein
MPNTPLLSPKQAAELLGLNKHTILRWIKTGRLPAQKLSAQTFRIRREDLDKLSEGKESK